MHPAKKKRKKKASQNPGSSQSLLTKCYFLRLCLHDSKGGNLSSFFIFCVRFAYVVNHDPPHHPLFLSSVTVLTFNLMLDKWYSRTPDPLKGKNVAVSHSHYNHPPFQIPLSPPPSFWPISIMTPPFWQPSISSSLPYVKVRGEEWKPGCFCPGRYSGLGVGGHFAPRRYLLLSHSDALRGKKKNCTQKSWR